jgi:hypothetical protein
MTVESTLTKKTYAGNGAATVWPVPFVYARGGPAPCPDCSSSDLI